MTFFRRHERLSDFVVAFIVYTLTSLPVLLGMLFSIDILLPLTARTAESSDLVSASYHFDALHYLDIIRHGYSYDPTRPSLVAFFPAYPSLSWSLSRLTGISPEVSALLVANLCLLGSFFFLARWLRLRWPDAMREQWLLVLATFGLWPLGYFFRMPYAESLFLCGTLAVLYGIERRWPYLVLGLLTGFVTGVRPVGVALTAAFLWSVLTRPEMRLRAKVGWMLLLTPLASWGLLAYMGYQWQVFGTPWGFAQTQQHWSSLSLRDHSWQNKLESLAMLEPIWGVYQPGYPRYWENSFSVQPPLFNLFFWNPILFLVAVALLVLGGWQRWLSRSECVLGAGLLAIPYVTRSFEMSMASHGRFAAVVIVNYLVIGRLLAWQPTLMMALVCVVLTPFLCFYTCLYAANYFVY